MKKESFKLLPFKGTGFCESTANPPEYSLSGTITLKNSQLQVEYLLQGDTSNIIIPAAKSTTQRTDKLWETTCFELFVKEPGRNNYWEYNLSPSGNWNVFVFDGYRSNKMDEASIENIYVDITHEQGSMVELSSVLPLPQSLRGKILNIGLSTILHTTSDEIYYFALTHSKSTPDFHDENSFIISI